MARVVLDNEFVYRIEYSASRILWLAVVRGVSFSKAQRPPGEPKPERTWLGRSGITVLKKAVFAIRRIHGNDLARWMPLRRRAV